MVFLILTRSGFDALCPRMNMDIDSLWLNAGVLSADEIHEWREAGWDLTTFSSRLDVADPCAVIHILREHHPDEVIWVEAAM